MFCEKWNVLDFARPEDLPFDVWMERDGSEAKIYVTYVGNHNKDLERALGYKEGKVYIMLLTPEIVCSLQKFVEKATPKGVAVLYKRIPPTPNPPEAYEIHRLFKCADAEMRHNCGHYDDGYCLAGRGKQCEQRREILAVHEKI